MSIAHNEPRSHFLAVLPWLAATASLAVLTVFVFYMHGNDSNHTGLEPWLLSIFFVPTLVVGIRAFVRGSSRWGALFALCLGFGGMAFLYYVDHFNVMLEYDRWIQRGMPPIPK